MYCEFWFSRWEKKTGKIARKNIGAFFQPSILSIIDCFLIPTPFRGLPRRCCTDRASGINSDPFGNCVVDAPTNE